MLSQFCSTAWVYSRFRACGPDANYGLRAGGAAAMNGIGRRQKIQRSNFNAAAAAAAASALPTAVAPAASIPPRCILGNTKSVGFRVMQAIMRPPPSPPLSPSSSNLQLRSRSNRTFIHLSCGRSLGRPHPPRVPDRANDVGAHASPRRRSLCLIFNRFRLF